MMRTIAAILAFTPAALFAQSTAPAQPSSTPVLQSALLQPVAFAASPSADSTAHSVRISTGVTAPVRLTPDTPVLELDDPKLLYGPRTVVISMTIDATGKPTDVKLVQSAGLTLVDNRVLDAVNQFRYRPGTMDGQPVAYPIRLQYNIQ